MVSLGYNNLKLFLLLILDTHLFVLFVIALFSPYSPSLIMDQAKKGYLFLYNFSAIRNTSLNDVYIDSNHAIYIYIHIYNILRDFDASGYPFS